MDKEINDIDAIIKVISALFGKLPVHIIHNGKEVSVKIIALKNQSLIKVANQEYFSTSVLKTS